MHAIRQDGFDHPARLFIARTRSRRGATVVVGVAILVAAVAVAGVATWVAMSRINASTQADAQTHGELLANMTGLGRPTKNKLAADFVDANGDLVADAPGDAAKQLDPPEIVFTYVASEANGSNAAATFKPLTDAIASATGKPVRYLPLTDGDAEVNALHDGSLHLCALNTGNVPNAVDVAGFVPVALLGGEGGPSTYQLKVIASTRTDIRAIDGLRGHELALTEMNSNSGFKAPLVLLQEKFGLRPGFDFGIRYSLGHTQSIDGLAKGTFDVVAVASDILAREEAVGTIKPADYRVLYASDPFPTACFGYAHDLKPELAAKIRSALLGFSFANNATAAYFAASGQTRFVPLDYAKDFALVRQIDDAIGYEHKLRTAATQPADDAAPQPATQP